MYQKKDKHGCWLPVPLLLCTVSIGLCLSVREPGGNVQRVGMAQQGAANKRLSPGNVLWGILLKDGLFNKVEGMMEQVQCCCLLCPVLFFQWSSTSSDSMTAECGLPRKAWALQSVIHQWSQYLCRLANLDKRVGSSVAVCCFSV